MALKKSEKRLLVMFGLGLFIAANMIGHGIIAARKAEAEAAAAQHKSRLVEYQLLLKSADKVDRQRAWLQRMQPRYISEEAAATEIPNHVNRCIDAAGATLDSIKPTEPVPLPNNMQQVAFNVNVSGSPEEVTRFVSLLQSREGFYAIPSVTFTTDRRDSTILRCAATVARWYSNEPSSLSAEAGGGGIAVNLDSN